jgi:hypothetical protein
MRVGLVDDAVLRAIGGDVLRPADVSAVLDGVFEALRPDAQSATLQRLRAELAEVERQIARLTEGVAAGGLLPSLIDVLKARHQRQTELRQEIESTETLTVVRLDRRGRGGRRSGSTDPLAQHAHGTCGRRTAAASRNPERADSVHTDQRRLSVVVTRCIAGGHSRPTNESGTGTGIRTPVPWLRNAAGEIDGLRLRRFP